jgi:Cu-processing system permease protein
MKLFFKIFKYQVRNILRSRWVIFYTLFYFLSTEALFQFSSDSSKMIVGLLNISLILIPVVSIIFGAIYIYNSREFIELLLSQPVDRSNIYAGIYFGMTIPLSMSFLIGVGSAMIFHNIENLVVFTNLLISGTLLTYIFMGISIMIAFKLNDKAAGIGVSFIVWMFFAIIYDALILLFIWKFSDFPLERAIIALSVLNPIDMARILVMLKFDAAALMGYTGATFEKFFGSSTGTLISAGAMIMWILIPYLIGLKIFKNKDF